MPATPQDRLYGLTTSVAVKPPVFISADYDVTRFGEQVITSSTPTGDRTVTTTEGMRILLMGQDNPVENGIWVARRSFWVRATDFNGPRDAVNGTLVFSITGDCWQVEAVDPVVIGLSAIHFRPTYPFEANLDIFQRTLRVPEASVSVLPSAEDRAWKGLGFDGAGQPKLQDPAGTGLWGYVPAIGSFEKGSIITERFQVLLWESTNEYWRWDGNLSPAKIVLPGSTPDTAGGRGKGKWLDVTDATLRSNLASEVPGMGAALVALEQGGTVQNHINTVSPDDHGAIANGIDDDSVSFMNAAATGKDLSLTPGATYLIASPAVLPFISGYKTGARRNIYGNGATIITTGPYEPFHQYTDDTKTATRVIKYGWNLFDLNVQGYANKDSVWDIVNKSIGWTYAYGRAERINGIGLNAVIRGYGHTLTRDCYGDDLRNNVLSLYNDPIDGVGYNFAFNTRAGWCTGDVVIIKCRNFYVDGVTYEYAGCVTAENADEITKVAAGSGEPRGVPVSLGADTTPGGDGVILNVSGSYFGAGAFSLNGDKVRVGGILDVGSHWTGNFNASLSGAAVWLNVKDSFIGFINSKDVYSGIGFNAGCENFRVDGMSVRSKMAIAGSVLCSATDSSSSAITRGSVGPIYLHGESSINNDVYLNTAGIVFEGIYIAQMNNQQGGYSVEFARACRVKDVSLVATTSAVTNTWVRFSANARVDNLMAERCFGTAFEVRAGAVPSFGDILLRNKQGDAPPVKVLGDGSASHFWGSLTISGPTSGHPTISGKLTLEGYTGLTWRLADVGVDGVVNYPDKVVHTITS